MTQNTVRSGTGLFDRKKQLIAIGLALSLMGVKTLVEACSPSIERRTPILLPLDELRAPITINQGQAIGSNGKIVVYGNYLFINEPKKGFHIFDNSNPASPRALAFVPVLGNLDITVKDDYLYADSYIDLLVFDVATPDSPQLVYRAEGTIEPEHRNTHFNLDDDAGVIIGFEENSNSSSWSTL
ncbi:MAG TPA: hypothetical protein VIC26_02810 [Marinagarivorans sp.]